MENSDDDRTDELMDNKQQYLIGFWFRLGAAMVDLLLVLLASIPLIILLQWVQAPPPIIVLVVNLLLMLYLSRLWVQRSATLGNWLFSHRVVDHTTGNHITFRQGVIRFLISYISAVPLFLGFFWVIWDKQKRSWHDKVAGTVVLSDSSYKSDASDRIYHPS